MIIPQDIILRDSGYIGKEQNDFLGLAAQDVARLFHSEQRGCDCVSIS
jgi:hypothetical protein